MTSDHPTTELQKFKVGWIGNSTNMETISAIIMREAKEKFAHKNSVRVNSYIMAKKFSGDSSY